MHYHRLSEFEYLHPALFSIGGLWKSQKFKGNLKMKRKQVDHKNGKKVDGRLRTVGEIVKKREKMNFMKNRRQSKRSSRGRGVGGAKGKGRRKH